MLKTAWVEEPPSCIKPRAHTWFELLSGPNEFRSLARVPAATNFGWWAEQRVASRHFMDTVREAGLTGLEFLPLAESRADDPMVWHEVYAQRPLGRGLDHPLIDPAKLETEKLKHGFDLARRWGEPVAVRSTLREEIEITNPVLLALLAMDALVRVEGPARFVREHLPTTDFAYFGWGNRPDIGPGYTGRAIRAICCNAMARQALIDSRAMKRSWFRPLATVLAADAGTAILDRTVPHPLPLPVYTPQEAAVERIRRQSATSFNAPQAASLSFNDTEDATTYIRRRLTDGSATWTPAENDDAFILVRNGKHFKKTPIAWQRLAPLLPMRATFADSEAQQLFDFVLQPPEWNPCLASSSSNADADEEPSKRDLVIAGTPYGDWYAFRKGDPLLPADARIVHWDHETMSTLDEWPSVAAFAAYIVNICDCAARASAHGTAT